MARFIRAADQAKMVRAALKQAFPSFKFKSIRSKTYSGGGSIDVEWIDGPTQKEVDAVVQKFRGGDFDGMTDYKSSHTSQIGDEEVSFQCDFIFARREFSEAFIQRTADTLVTLPGQTVCDLLNKSNRMMHDKDETVLDQAKRIVRILSLATPEAVDNLPRIIATH